MIISMIISIPFAVLQSTIIADYDGESMFGRDSRFEEKESRAGNDGSSLSAIFLSPFSAIPSKPTPIARFLISFLRVNIRFAWNTHSSVREIRYIRKFWKPSSSR